MNIIFQISGGIGKCIASTAVCASIKRKYPESKLIVVSGYPEVYLNNPNVDRSFAFGQQQYFYTEYIQNQEILVLAHDPYVEANHIMRKEHLIETWCNMYDLPVVHTKGELFLNRREIDFYTGKYYSDKPIFLLQSNGGGPNELKYSWARDMPSYVAKDVIAEFKEQYHIVHLKREDQIGYEGTTPVTDSIRGLLVLITLSQKRLFIDSFAQHAAGALDKSSTVLWVCNDPKVFGYELHTNINSNPETIVPELRNAYFSKYNIGGELHEFPYNEEKEIFDVKKIIDSLK